MQQRTASPLKVTQEEWLGKLPTIETSSPEFPRLRAHDARWIDAISRGLKHRVYLLTAYDSNDRPAGYLPLCLVAGPIFGKFLVSLPYVNTGGVVASHREIADGLAQEALRLADQLKVKHLELRHELPLEGLQQFNLERTDKVHMRLQLPDTVEELRSSLKSKVRSQVKKSHESGLTFEFGQQELLKDFYDVFAVNMRDLGTPVFSKRLFLEILDQFSGDAEICVVRSGRRAAAAALLVHAQQVTEVPSASCLREFNRMNANMFMYWQLLERAIERGSQVFDFGRSSAESGTYRFKKQWGAVPEPATWQYYVRQGDPADMRPDSEGKQRLVRIWQKLPVWMTRCLGPTIVRGIP